MMKKPTQLEKLEKQFHKNPSSRLFFPIAEAYRNAGMYDKAIELYKQGLLNHPNYVSARVSLGRALISLEQYEEARSELETVVSSVPENLMAQKLLADVYFATADFAPALEQYKAVLSLNPNDREAQVKIEQITSILEENEAEEKEKLESTEEESEPRFDEAESAIHEASEEIDENQSVEEEVKESFDALFPEEDNQGDDTKDSADELSAQSGWKEGVSDEAVVEEVKKVLDHEEPELPPDSDEPNIGDERENEFIDNELSASADSEPESAVWFEERPAEQIVEAELNIPTKVDELTDTQEQSVLPDEEQQPFFDTTPTEQADETSEEEKEIVEPPEELTFFELEEDRETIDESLTVQDLEATPPIPEHDAELQPTPLDQAEEELFFDTGEESESDSEAMFFETQEEKQKISFDESSDSDTPIFEVKETEAFEPEVTFEEQSDDNSSVATLTMAELYESQGHHVDALKIYKQLEQKSPDDTLIKEKIEALREKLQYQPAPTHTPIKEKIPFESDEPEVSKVAFTIQHDTSKTIHQLELLLKKTQKLKVERGLN